MKFLNKDGVTYLWGKIKTALNGKQDTLTFDNAPTEGSDNPVKSGGIKAALDGKKNTQTAVSSPAASGNALAFIDTISQNEQGVIRPTKKSVTVDTTPTANSTNPVQSGGVKAALDGKQNALTFDSAPTANSDNPVKSSGIKAALDEKLNTIGKGINLLDNWYFVGGGSQQGGGQFPINQRGQSSYTGNVYGIDRWNTVSWNSTPTMFVGSDGVRLVGESNYSNSCLMQQKIENASRYAGKQLTASAIISNIISGNSIRLYIGINGDQRYTSVVFRSTGLYSVTFQVPPDTESMYFMIGQHGSDGGRGKTDIEILATKLELGDTQTLAHQENGAWVLNDPPPDYDTELLKCQMSTADSSDTYANRAVAKADSIAIIVDGDTAGTAVSAGQYAYIRNNTHGLKEGLYRNKSSSAFPVSGGTADGTVFEAVPGGGFNNLLTDYMVITNHYITTGETSETQSAPTYPWELIAAKPGYTGVMFNFTSVPKSSQTIINAETVFFRDGKTTIRGYCSRPSLSVTIVILWKRNG